MLLEALAVHPDKSSGTPQTGNFPESSHRRRAQQEKSMENRTYLGNPDRHDQSVAQESRFNICQRAVGEHSLPGYGPVDSVKRPVRTRMRGTVGAGGERPPATRLALGRWFFWKLCAVPHCNNPNNIALGFIKKPVRRYHYFSVGEFRKLWYNFSGFRIIFKPS